MTAPEAPTVRVLAARDGMRIVHRSPYTDEEGTPCNGEIIVEKQVPDALGAPAWVRELAITESPERIGVYGRWLYGLIMLVSETTFLAGAGRIQRLLLAAQRYHEVNITEPPPVGRAPAGAPAAIVAAVRELTEAATAFAQGAGGTR